MENDVNLKEILFIKISENPRKGFLQSLDREINKIKKTHIFFNPTSLKLSFALGHRIFHGNSCFLGHSIFHICLQQLDSTN